MVLGRPGRAWGVDVTEEKYELFADVSVSHHIDCFARTGQSRS
jgi:hypothetical protein